MNSPVTDRTFSSRSPSPVPSVTASTLTVDSDPEKGCKPDEPDLNYELPAFVRSLKEGWHTSFQAAAVVSTLFAQTAAQFLGTIKGANDPPINPTIQTALLIFSYGGIIFGYSATISSLFLNERVAALPILANFKVCKEILPQLKTRPLNTVFQYYNMGERFKFLFWHFLISLILGTLCNFLQVFVFVCVAERSTSIAIPVAMGVAMLWCLLFFVFAVLP